MRNDPARSPRSLSATRLSWLAVSFVVSEPPDDGLHRSQTPRRRREQAPQPAHEEGTVRIQEASRPFIQVEEVSAATSDSAVTAPAKVDFRDGAISQVGAPLEGRVVTVHVLVGQRVSAGDQLVTLDCPEAATMRAAAAVAQASLREARIELERQRRMQKEGVGVERDVVATETRVSTAEAELTRVEAGAMSIGNGTATAVVVRAPIDGVVIGQEGECRAWPSSGAATRSSKSATPPRSGSWLTCSSAISPTSIRARRAGSSSRR